MSPAGAQNALTNPGFETPTNPANPAAAYSITGVSSGGASAASGFSMYNNSANTTTTSLLTSTDTLSPPGNYMIQITSGGSTNGIYQSFTPLTFAYANVDVFVTSGSARLYLYTNGGNTQISQVTSATTNQWERLSLAPSPNSANEFVLYTGPGGGNFYADNAYVSQTPLALVPESSGLTNMAGALLALSLIILLGAVKKKMKTSD